MRVVEKFKSSYNFIKKYKIESIIAVLASGTFGYIVETHMRADDAYNQAIIAQAQALDNKNSRNHYIDHNDQEIAGIKKNLFILNRMIGNIEGQQNILDTLNSDLLAHDLGVKKDDKTTKN